MVKINYIIYQLIIPCKTTLVKDILLVENSILASKIIHGYNKNKGTNKINIKVDISKAFDNLHMGFLFSCL